jgi:3-oxoacyl-[acyl-carrier protein] reductase
MNLNLKNKKILITGASGGIGKVLCKKFIEYECQLIITSSNIEKLGVLKNLFGSNHLYYQLNFSNKVELISNVKIIAEENKDIDVLINNAGTTKDNLLLRMSDEQWNDVININLNSNYHIIKTIIPNMIKNKSGNIIGITSVVAITGNAGQSNYTASKAGMISMYKSLALEVSQRNININLIAPGFIESPMTDKLNESQKKIIMDKIPMKKFGSPSDIANIALFLASNQSSYITGQTFHVNGGMLML